SCWPLFIGAYGCILVYKLLQGDGWCVPNIPSHGADPSTHVTIRGSSGLRRFFRYAMLSIHSIYVMSLYPFTERYAQPYFFSCFIRQIHAEIREEFRTSSEPSDAGGNPPPVTIHTWLERFNKQKPHSFEMATAPVDAENWISHMEKIFDVMGCEDAFRTRLAVYKFEGNALTWWKDYKQAKGGDAWLIT
nr:zinc finger, CCHC-type, retrotransposon Gag domain protein [Tanacetum cinerariifolium]